MNSPAKSVSELIAELEERGVTKEQIAAYAQEELDRRTSEEAAQGDDPLTAISAKLDTLQESVDRLAERLDAK